MEQTRLKNLSRHFHSWPTIVVTNKSLSRQQAHRILLQMPIDVTHRCHATKIQDPCRQADSNINDNVYGAVVTTLPQSEFTRFI